MNTVLPADGDIFFAYKALSICGFLTCAERRVAGAIIDHFNQKTGRCDPSLARLTKVTGLDTRTIKRATSALTGKYDQSTGKCTQIALFRKESHGGRHGCVRYQPIWENFRIIADQWGDRMKVTPDENDRDCLVITGADTKTTGASVSPNRGQGCPQMGGENVPQTTLMNQSKEPIEVKNKQKKPAENSNPEEIYPPPEQEEKPRKRLWKERDQRTTQRHLLLPIEGGSQISKGQALRENAIKRVNDDLFRMGDTYQIIAPWLPNEVAEAAYSAEVRSSGAGIRLILSAYQQRNSVAC